MLGFLSTSILGGFGATAAACRLQGCSVDQTVNAMGIWYAYGSGNRQALFDRTLTKRIQPGIAARAGVFASYLARKSFTGPNRIIGGQHASLLSIYGCRHDAEPTTVKEIMAPRRSWEIERLSYKCYASCGHSGRPIEMATALATEHKLKPEDIREIRLFGDNTRSPFGAVAWSDSDTPHVLAQFCITYAAASAIKNRRYGPAEVAPDQIAKDRDVDALARRTKMCGWSQWEGARPKARAGMQIFLTDGRSTKTLERGYHLMSLNEMGCGALAGTSWPIDRDLVSQHLGMELVRVYAGQMIGHLTGVAVAGLRTPHGDAFEMLYMAEPTLAALKTTGKCTSKLTAELRNLQVHKERMLALIRDSYICATELANQLVRDYKLSYRTAHEVVHEFVVLSEEQKVPASQARAELLDEAAQKVLGRKLEMPEARLRQLLDPAYLIKVENSKGGVAPEETARMITDRREKLAEARARHLKRIETLEKAEKRMLSDLRQRQVITETE
ncbi:MAG: MmgE/PrpD family protein [Pirellulaceae bacterium]